MALEMALSTSATDRAILGDLLPERPSPTLRATSLLKDVYRIGSSAHKSARGRGSL
jgi:hypothetical protein